MTPIITSQDDGRVHMSRICDNAVSSHIMSYPYFLDWMYCKLTKVADSSLLWAAGLASDTNSAVFPSNLWVQANMQHERVSLHVQWSSQHELSEHPSISLILCTIHSLSSQHQTKLCFSLMQALRSTGRTLDPHQTYSNIAKRAEHAKVLLEGTGHVKRIKDCSFTCLSFTAKHAKRYSLSTLSDIFHFLSPSARHFGAEPRAVSLSFL